MPRCTFCDCMNSVDARKCERCGAEMPAAEEGAASTTTAAIKLPEDVESRIAGLLHDRQKIEAIKLYRQVTNAGLKDAKDAVEAMERKLGISSGGAGCAGMLVLCLVAASVVIWVLH